MCVRAYVRACARARVCVHVCVCVCVMRMCVRYACANACMCVRACVLTPVSCTRPRSLRVHACARARRECTTHTRTHKHVNRRPSPDRAHPGGPRQGRAPSTSPVHTGDVTPPSGDSARGTARHGLPHARTPLPPPLPSSHAWVGLSPPATWPCFTSANQRRAPNGTTTTTTENTTREVGARNRIDMIFQHPVTYCLKYIYSGNAKVFSIIAARKHITVCLHFLKRNTI